MSHSQVALGPSGRPRSADRLDVARVLKPSSPVLYETCRSWGTPVLLAAAVDNGLAVERGDVVVELARVCGPLLSRVTPQPLQGHAGRVRKLLARHVG